MTAPFGFISRLLAALALATPLLAQDEFPNDVVPTITFSETRLQNVRFDPEGESYETVYTTASASISCQASLRGVDLTAIDAETPISISVGDFSFDAVLGDSPNYTAGDRTIVFPLDADGDERNDGNLTVRYSADEVTFTLNVSRDVDGAFSPIALSLEGSEYAPGEYEEVIIGGFGFADRAVEELRVYVVGTRVRLYSRTVAAGTDDEEIFEDLVDIAVKGASDDQPPTVVFQSPAAGTKVHTSSQPVILTASDEHAVTSVEVQLNTGDWQPATLLAPGVWTFNAALNKGLNTLAARATDTDGNQQVTPPRAITFAPLAAVTITAAGTGAGRVTASFLTALNYTPDQPSPVGAATLEEGELLKVTAAPAANSIFERWTANVPLTAAEAAAPVLQIALTPDLALTAHFIPNPFLETSGRFRGVIMSEDPTRRGFFTAVLNARGVFTATLRIDRQKVRLRGQFPSNGPFIAHVTKGQRLYTVELGLTTLSDGSVQLRGSVTGTGELSAEVVADRSELETRKQTTPFAGSYILILTPDEANTDANYPPVPGFGEVIVKRSGAARFVGVLGDGTRTSFGGSVSETGRWAFFAPLYGKKGSLSGTMIFPAAPESTVSGFADWFKPTRVSGEQQLIEGFSGRSNVSGTKIR